MIVAAGCKHKYSCGTPFYKNNKILYPYGWTKTEPRFDSLTKVMEEIWVDKETFDIDKIDSLLSAMNLEISQESPKEMQCRLYYWKARKERVGGNTAKSRQYFEKAVALCDSDLFPYDKVRIDWSSEPEYSNPSVEYCLRLMNQVEILKQSGDIVYTGGRLLELGSLLVDIDRNDLGLPYLRQADSLLALAGKENMRVFNQINFANACYYAGDSVNNRKILDELVKNDYVKDNPAMLDLVLGNRYSQLNERSSLHSAYANAKANPWLTESLAICEAYLAEEYLDRSMPDSAAYFINLAMQHSDDIEYDKFRKEYYKILSRWYEENGNYKKAKESSQISAEISDSMLRNEEASKIIGIELEKKLNDDRLKAEIQHRNNLILMWLIIGIVVIAALLIGWMIYMKIQGKRIKNLKLQLDLEHSHRKNLALQLNLEERDGLRKELQNRIGEMKESGEISAGVASRLEDPFRNEMLVKREQENFMTTFAEMRPDFIRIFKERYPQASDSECRLAIYIALGLDNKHIARLSGIRTESVKQARWRLRKKMNLPENQTLEQALASLDDTNSKQK